MNNLSHLHPSDATRFGIAAAVAEHLYGGDWCVLAAPEKCAPVVGWLHCPEDETTPTLTLAMDDKRMYIARPRSQGRTEHEQLTELFEEVAAELFPELDTVAAA